MLSQLDITNTYTHTWQTVNACFIADKRQRRQTHTQPIMLGMYTLQDGSSSRKVVNTNNNNQSPPTSTPTPIAYNNNNSIYANSDAPTEIYNPFTQNLQNNNVYNDYSLQWKAELGATAVANAAQTFGYGQTGISALNYFHFLTPNINIRFRSPILHNGTHIPITSAASNRQEPL
jgi:hypothetical protein